MTDRDALLAAVRAAPGDDLPRLVLADFLEEGGDAGWAATIRAMCQLRHEFDAEVLTERAGLGGAVPASPAAVRPALAWLQSTAPADLSLLLGGRRCECVPGDYVWLQRCPKLDLVVEWRRGFIHLVRGPQKALRWHLPAVRRLHPVERAEATNVRPVGVVRDARDGAWSVARVLDQPPERWLLVETEDGPTSPFDCFTPRPVFERLRGGRLEEAADDECASRDYASAAAGLDDLSQALLAEARDALAAGGPT